MKILLGTDTFPPTVNGAARFTERYAHALSRAGHEVHVVCPSPTGRRADDEHDLVRVHELASIGYYYYPGFRLSLPWSARRGTRDLVAELAPDVVHIQDNFIIGRGLASACERLGVPLVATNHLMPANFFDHVPLPKPLRSLGAKLLWADMKRVYAKAGVVTSPTPKAVELFGAATGFTGAVAVSNGIDIDTYQNAVSAARFRPPTPERPPTVLFVGRLDQEKRVGDLIAAFARLPAALPARLVIVGDGSLRQKLMAQAAPLGRRVEFAGRIDDEELLRAYVEADVFCMPGVAELQSLVTLEAMAAGKPVLAANAMALPHLCHPGVNGQLFEPGDIAQLAGHLEELLRDPERRTAMGEASVQIVAEHTSAATLAILVGFYERLVGLRELAEAA